MNQTEAVQNFGSFLIDLAAEEGRKFKEEHGRLPTEAEAEQIASMIQRQLETAIILKKGAD